MAETCPDCGKCDKLCRCDFNPPGRPVRLSADMLSEEDRSDLDYVVGYFADTKPQLSARIAKLTDRLLGKGE